MCDGAFDGVKVGNAVGERVVGLGVGALDGLKDGCAVGARVVGLCDGAFDGVAWQTVVLYVADGYDVQLAFVGSKNPIIFHVGRIEISNPSQTYDRTKFVTLPCPGKLDPKNGVK